MTPMDRSRYPDNWEEIAEEIKSATGYLCQKCGMPHEGDGTPGSILTVHHINGNPENCDPLNLIALCARCHLQAEPELRRALAALTAGMPTAQDVMNNIVAFFQGLKATPPELAYRSFANDTIRIIRGHCESKEINIGQCYPGDALITDPGYLYPGKSIPIKGRSVAPRRVESRTVGNPWEYVTSWISRFRGVGNAIVFASAHMLPTLIPALEAIDLELQVIFTWRKPNATPAQRNVPRPDTEFIVWARKPGIGNGSMHEFKSQVIEVNKLQAGCMASPERILAGNGTKAAFHPAQKPVAVVQPFIERLQITGWVYDPFAGVGTVAIAAYRAGKPSNSVEINPVYFERACARIEAETNRDAFFQRGGE